jgi:hypothetical protein
MTPVVVEKMSEMLMTTVTDRRTIDHEHKVMAKTHIAIGIVFTYY